MLVSKNMDISQLSSVLADQPKFRYQQINQAVFKEFVSTWDEVSNLPKNLREKLAEFCPLEIKAKLFKDQKQSKGAKALIYLSDGEAVETVLIRQSSSSGRVRNTVCLSSQVGCPLACSFCATGQAGFNRNLSSAEIVEQAVFWERYLKTIGPEQKINNVVFMGMGEPLLNYDQFIKAVKFLNNPETLNIGARHISVSTAGIVDKIKRLAGEKLQINLAISLHAPNDGLRASLMPVARKYSLREIFQAVDNYIKKTSRRVMFEYLLIKGVNDHDQEAQELVEELKKPLYFVNLIPYNETGGHFRAPDSRRVEAFHDILMKGGVPATIRRSFGEEIAAACGQLRGQVSDQK